MEENKENVKTQELKPTNNTILERKLRTLLDSRLESDTETIAALAELSTFFSDNTLKTRRHLRGEIERRSLEDHRKFVEALETVMNRFESFYSTVRTMNSDCERMCQDLAETETKTRDLIRQTNRLRSESIKLNSESQVLNQFRTRFRLTEEEEELILSKTSRIISAPFFQALERVRKIHKDCQVLLRSGQQTTALEIMEKMTLYQEAGLEKLYRWTQSHCRNIDGENGPILSESMKHLQDRPVLFKYVMTEYCNARKSLLVKSFLDALTIGGPGGTPRPIELHAHDPQRYVGDMLAWLHQAVPTENENVHSLLKLCHQIDVEQTCEESLASITESVCRPLQTRVEQVVLSEQDPIVLFKLTNLIRFYLKTFQRLLHVKSTPLLLLLTLTELDTLGYNQFINGLQSTTTTLIIAMTNTTLSPDLTPSSSTLALCSLLKDILSSSTIAIEEQERQFTEIVNAVVDPLIRSLNTSVSGLPSTDQDVYILNSLYRIYTTLSLFQFIEAKIQSLESEMGIRMDTLSSEQTSNLIANLGLRPICTLLSATSTTSSLSRVEGMDQDSIRRFTERFDDFLSSPDSFLLPQTSLLLSSSHRKASKQRPLSVILASYKQLYEAVHDPNNEYDQPNHLMSKTPDQVAILLEI